MLRTDKELIEFADKLAEEIFEHDKKVLQKIIDFHEKSCEAPEHLKEKCTQQAVNAVLAYIVFRIEENKRKTPNIVVVDFG